ncbi:MAG: hypothetical protein K9G61_11115 [Bacteroidales bacterium]|nr:hypothetical protein [Bacteroidales bacterium]
MRKAFQCITVMLFFGALILFEACSKDNPNPGLQPEINFIVASGYTSTDTVLSINQQVRIGIQAHSRSGAPITQFTAITLQNGITSVVDSGLFSEGCSVSKQIRKSAADVETWKFFVRDRNGNTSDTLVINLIKDNNSGYGAIKTVTGLTLGAQNNTQTGSFYSILHDQVYFLPMAFLHQEDCDLLYYFDPIETDAHTIASPGANLDASVYNSNEAPMYWEIRRTIRFEKQSDLTEETFLQCTNDSLILARSFVFGTGKRKAKNLDTGHIYSFVSEQGQKGLFLVTAREGTAAGSVQITLKIQKP